MKFSKLFGTLFGAALLFGAASCDKENDLSHNPAHADETTFCVTAPHHGTRAFSDGLTANQLVCFVYDEAGELVTHTETPEKTVTMAEKTGTVKVKLSKGVKYQIVFIARAAFEEGKSPYSVDAENHLLEVDYTKMEANSDANDLFYAKIDFEGGKYSSFGVELKRPMAQVNFGTDDLDNHMVKSAYGTDLQNLYTEITVKDVFSQMDLLSGLVVGENGNATLTSKKALVKDIQNTGDFPMVSDDATKPYVYVGMAYVLVPDANMTTFVGLKSFLSDAADAKCVLDFSQEGTPLRRNFRTNFAGSLFTSTTDFNVTVTPGFTDPKTPEEAADHNKLVP